MIKVRVLGLSFDKIYFNIHALKVQKGTLAPLKEFTFYIYNSVHPTQSIFEESYYSDPKYF